MEPLTWIIAIFIVTEFLDGGLGTATAVHAGKVGGQTAGKHMASSARSAYAKRKVELSKSKTGRWRLAAEARLGRLGKWGAKAGKGVVVGAAGVTAAVAKGVIAGAKTAPAGAMAGVTWWTEKTPQGKAAKAWWDSRGDTPTDSDAQPDDTEGDTSSSAPDAMPDAEPTPSDTPAQTAGDAPSPPDVPADSPPVVPVAPDKTSAPEVPAGEGVSMSNDLSAEDKGAAPYVKGWASAPDGYEPIIADLTQRADALSGFVDANSQHHVGGETDAVGMLRAAVEALTAAGERLSSQATSVAAGHPHATEMAGSSVGSQAAYAGSN